MRHRYRRRRKVEAERSAAVPATSAANGPRSTRNHSRRLHSALRLGSASGDAAPALADAATKPAYRTANRYLAESRKGETASLARKVERTEARPRTLL
jgi:hypothetical protein